MNLHKTQVTQGLMSKIIHTCRDLNKGSVNETKWISNRHGKPLLRVTKVNHKEGVKFRVTNFDGSNQILAIHSSTSPFEKSGGVHRFIANRLLWSFEENGVA